MLQFGIQLLQAAQVFGTGIAPQAHTCVLQVKPVERVYLCAVANAQFAHKHLGLLLGYLLGLALRPFLLGGLRCGIQGNEYQ